MFSTYRGWPINSSLSPETKIISFLPDVLTYTATLAYKVICGMSVWEGNGGYDKQFLHDNIVTIDYHIKLTKCWKIGIFK